MPETQPLQRIPLKPAQTDRIAGLDRRIAELELEARTLRSAFEMVLATIAESAGAGPNDVYRLEADGSALVLKDSGE